MLFYMISIRYQMVRRRTGRDIPWGERPKSSLMRRLIRTPEDAARFQLMFTGGMILFYLLLFLGMGLALYFIAFGTP